MKNTPLSSKKHRHNLIGTAVLGSIIFALLFYGLVHYLPLNVPLQVRQEFVKNVVSTLHAIFCLTSILLILCKKMKETTWEYLFAITQGYFIFDFILALIFPQSYHDPQQRILMLTHHVAIFIISLFRKPRPFVRLGLLSEFAVIFLNLCIIIHLILPKYKKTIPFMVFSMVSLLLYFVNRVLLFTYVFWKSFQQFQKEKKIINQKQWIEDVTSLFLFFYINLLNYFWFYKLLKIAYRQLSKMF